MDTMISKLESQIKALTKQCEALKQSNEKLRAIKHQLTQEKETILAKHTQAVSQIETLVSHLKFIETPSYEKTAI